MLFNSLSFLIFFPIVTVLYFVARPPSEVQTGYRWIVLLTASCLFYMWFIPEYILILALTIAVDFTAGISIEKSVGQTKKNYLLISVITTCSILFFFKYFHFFNVNSALIAERLGLHYPIPVLDIILPIGLSFHTFQSLSYVIEVYRGKQKAEKHLGIFALYIMFYPQLVAGPIERPQNLLHQFREPHTFDYPRVTQGLLLMAFGFFKKTVVADRLSILVNTVYATPSRYIFFRFSDLL